MDLAHPINTAYRKTFEIINYYCTNKIIINLEPNYNTSSGYSIYINFISLNFNESDYYSIVVIMNKIKDIGYKTKLYCEKLDIENNIQFKTISCKVII